MIHFKIRNLNSISPTAQIKENEKPNHTHIIYDGVQADVITLQLQQKSN